MVILVDRILELLLQYQKKPFSKGDCCQWRYFVHIYILQMITIMTLRASLESH